MRRAYVIDVCRTCGQQAIFPFCEHRPSSYDTRPWTVAITVEATATSQAILEKLGCPLPK